MNGPSVVTEFFLLKYKVKKNSFCGYLRWSVKAVVGNQNFFSFGFPCSFKEGLKVLQKKLLMKTEIRLLFLVELFNSFIFCLKIRKTMGAYCFDTWLSQNCQLLATVKRRIFWNFFIFCLAYKIILLKLMMNLRPKAVHRCISRKKFNISFAKGSFFLLWWIFLLLFQSAS